MRKKSSWWTVDQCYIIAEIGGNFTTWDEARRLVDAATLCGVNAVKLQTYRADNLATRAALFDMENTGVTSQYEMFKKYEIDEELHARIFKHAASLGLDCFSTPSHESDVEMLERLGARFYKIGSDDLTNLPFLRNVARTHKPILLSTGMSTLEEVRDAVAAIAMEGNEQMVLLHAITSYPTHPDNVNLAAIKTLQDAFPDCIVGYSDHTLTPVAALCAAAMGARVIERHFTWDKQAIGPDHQLSSDPAEMKWLVDAIRAYEVMLGGGEKVPAASEEKTRINNRKSVVVQRAIPKGQVIGRADLAVKRPGTGIAPKCLDEIVGRRAARDLAEDEVLSWDALV